MELGRQQVDGFTVIQNSEGKYLTRLGYMMSDATETLWFTEDLGKACLLHSHEKTETLCRRLRAKLKESMIVRKVNVIKIIELAEG